MLDLGCGSGRDCYLLSRLVGAQGRVIGIDMIQRIVLLLLLAGLVGAFFALGLDRYFSLEYVQNQRSALIAYRDAQPALVTAGFFVVYVLVTALSIPGAAVLTLAAGGIFGVVWGTVLVSFASTAGATGAFLFARYLFRDGIERDGPFYLFTLRLVPVIPFFLINLLLGLTQMRARTFFWVSQLGMLAGTIVYVNAGTQLAQLTSLRGVLSPGLIGAFILLGVFPLIGRKLVDTIKARRVYAPYRRPTRFDRNMIVIGGGSGGLVSAYIAATVKAKVTLVEKHKMGGDCLNTGCVPSKALIRSAKFASHLQRAGEFGFGIVSTMPDFARVMERVQSLVRTVEPHDSVERFTELGVEVREGAARLVDPFVAEGIDVRVDTKAKAVVVDNGEKVLVCEHLGKETRIPFDTRTLDWVEHDTLRPRYRDPRVHFATNCASVGCPALRPEPYTAEQLDAQLEDQQRRFLSDRSRNRYNPADGVLNLSQIFRWYGDDFAANGRTLQDWLSRPAALLADNDADRQKLRSGVFRIEHLSYDWMLNAERRGQ